jgi:hypothetical protein
VRPKRGSPQSRLACSRAYYVRYEIAATESHESLVSRFTRSPHPFGEQQLHLQNSYFVSTPL